MALNIKSTADLLMENIITIVYGQAGAGKTSLIATLPKPFILSTDNGLLSIQKYTNIPYVDVKTKADYTDIMRYLKNKEAKETYQTIVIDSITKLGDMIFNEESKTQKDNRQAYLATQFFLQALFKDFKDMPYYNTYFTAQMREAEDEVGKPLYAPYVASKGASAQVAGDADIVMALRINKDGSRFLMCNPDNRWLAKDRSCQLSQIEPADLGAIFKKIGVTI